MVIEMEVVSTAGQARLKLSINGSQVEPASQALVLQTQPHFGVLAKVILAESTAC